MFIVWSTLALMFVAFVLLMFNTTIPNWDISTSLYDWFGIMKDDNAKHEALRFIGFGMGGVLATIGAVAFNRRAASQIEASKAQTKHNELIEEGNINDRFQKATVNLGHRKRRVRITSFYQFYYLAKVSEYDFRKGIFDILCDHLRHITSGQFYNDENEGKDIITNECQTLLNILFKPEYKSVFDEFYAEFENINLTRANLSSANLLTANLRNANLSDINLSGANLSNADLSGAYLAGAYLAGASLSSANLTGTYLLDTNLSDANLSDAYLAGANLSGANLSGGHLLSANLSGTNLTGANLSNAYLSGADISNAYLIEADLSNAKFPNKGFIKLDHPTANLSDSLLSNADLSGTNFMGVQLKGVDLQDVHSIEKADFSWAKMGDRVISPEDLPTNKGQYIAPWATPEFWAEAEKNEES